MPNMGESNWRLGDSTGSLGSTSSTPRLCTHRTTYHDSVEIMSPKHPSPSGDSAVDSPTTSWSPRERDRHFQVDMAHIRLQPEIKADLPPSVHPHSAREPLQGHSSSHHGDPTVHRPVNEQLDNYMVIKQRSFHGYLRSKRDLRQLPQTDPREDAEVNPNWLHRSKTDMYIERRRAKLASLRTCRRGGSGGYNLSGITLGNLMNQLPITGKRDHDGNSKMESRTVDRNKLNSPAGETSGETRFPPLTLNRMKQRIQNDIHNFSREADHQRPSTTNALPTSSTTFHIPDAPPNSPPLLPDRETPRYVTRGRLRKETLGSIPLRIWEPSLDYVLRSDAKVLQPRSALKSFTRHTAVRQQPSPLK